MRIEMPSLLFNKYSTLQYTFMSHPCTCNCPPIIPQSTVIFDFSLRLSLAPVVLYFRPSNISPANGHPS